MNKIINKFLLFLLMVMGTLSLAQADISKHFNMGYSTSGLPVNINDRYYSQDLGRDHWYTLEKAGIALRDVTGQLAFIVNGGSVTQNLGTNQINISSGICYVPYQVTIPLSFNPLPPSTTSQDVGMIRVSFPAIFNLDISMLPVPALLNGSTNYVKFQYFDAPASTRSYALKTGSYFCENVSSYTLTIDTTPPTKYQAVFASIISTGTNAPMSIGVSSKTALINLPTLGSTQTWTGQNTFNAQTTFLSPVVISSQIVFQNGKIDTGTVTQPIFTPPLNSILPIASSIIISTLTITTQGNPIFLTVAISSMDLKTDGGGQVAAQLYLERDGVNSLPGGNPFFRLFGVTASVDEFFTPSFSIIDNPPAGTYTYHSRYLQTFGSVGTINPIVTGSIIAIELKR